MNKKKYINNFVLHTDNKETNKRNEDMVFIGSAIVITSKTMFIWIKH